MKKNLLLLFAILLINIRAYSQNPLPNPGFENWTSQGIYEDPDNWNTLNPSTAILGVLTAQKATGIDVHTGNNAIKLTTKSVLGQNANGIATTGTINTSAQTITGGVAYNGRPDSIAGWFKYTPAGGDNGFLAFILMNSVEDTIGFANFTTPTTTVGNYTYFSVAVNYYNSAVPDLARCLLSSSAGFTSVLNSTMYIDDLQLIFNSTGTRENLPLLAPSVNYSSVSHILRINTQSESMPFVRILDASGRIVKHVLLESGRNEISTSGLLPGIYFVVLFDEKSGQKFTKKILFN